MSSTTGQLISGKVLSRAGKASGKYKNCYNIRYDSDGNIGWIDLKDINSLSTITDSKEMLMMFNTDEVLKAKNAEIANWLVNDVYEEVYNTRQRVMSVR